MTNNTVAVVIEGAGAGERVLMAGSRQAAPGFFDVMRIPILVGRAIDARDRPGSPLRGRDHGVDGEDVLRRPQRRRPPLPLDQKPAMPRRWHRGFEVVGVAPDTGGDVADPELQAFYYAVEQATLPLGRGGAAIIARTSGDASALVRDLQRELLAIDPSLPVFTAMTMKQRVEQAQAGAVRRGVVAGRARGARARCWRASGSTR